MQNNSLPTGIFVNRISAWLSYFDSFQFYNIKSYSKLKVFLWNISHIFSAKK